MDVAIAGLLFFPAMFVVMVLAGVMWLVYRYPPFYLSKRIGRGGREFSCLKLRTIRPHEDAGVTLDFAALGNANTLPIGRLLRDRGLDELPQLVNVLLGQMSMVGPRPLLSLNFVKIRGLNGDCLERIVGWETRRKLVRPGLSGWHQIRSACTDIIRYDLEYLDDPSLTRQFTVFVTSVRILLVGKIRYFGWVTAP